jgi:sulfate adenylyltransferase subunit 2
MLYSVGKDSAVMLHLARKAFYPAAALPAAVDTTWKFRAMYDRDKMAEKAAWSCWSIRTPRPRSGHQPLRPWRCTPTCGRRKG